MKVDVSITFKVDTKFNPNGTGLKEWKKGEVVSIRQDYAEVLVKTGHAVYNEDNKEVNPVEETK